LVDIFDSKVAAGEPVLSEAFIAVALIRFYRTEPGVYRFQFLVKERSGKVLVNSTEIVSVSDLPAESTVFCLQCRMGQAGLRFGEYEFSIESDGKQLACTPLYVIQGST
jgi:hypothetical protein